MIGRPRKDLTGQRFHKLVALSFSHMKNSQSYWLFKCDCGNEKIIRSSKVIDKSGITKSCGCHRAKHNECSDYRRTKVYLAWASMRGRCFNPNNPKYETYGGAGIEICKRWDDYKNFLNDMGQPPSSNHSLDRIDSSGNYQPSNCRWATKKQQAHNTKPWRCSESKFKGVSRHGASWGASIKGKRIGSYPTQEDAALAYDRAAFDLWGDDAYINLPELLER